MFDWLTLHVIALMLVAAQFGGILLFAALITPLAFRVLPDEPRGDFLRAVFPVYYRVMGILALIAALPLVPYPGANMGFGTRSVPPTDMSGAAKIDMLAPGSYEVRVVGREDVTPIQASVGEGAGAPVTIRLP